MTVRFSLEVDVERTRVASTRGSPNTIGIDMELCIVLVVVDDDDDVCSLLLVEEDDLIIGIV